MGKYMLCNTEQLDSDMKSVADTIRAKGGTTNQLHWPDGYKTAVEAISTGVTVKIKTGNVTGVSGSSKSVDVGFKPDAVFFTGSHPYTGKRLHCGVAFTANNITSCATLFAPPSSAYMFSEITVSQNSNGFSVKGTRVDLSLDESSESNRTLSYIAIKYT